jgi:polyisoprenyl-phosphate glycosyltransferase
LPVDAGDFKLLSRPALSHLLALGESDPYLRGLVVWIGFQQACVPYEREARHAGKTHFPFFSRNPWKTFAIGLTSFSFMPIFVVIGAAAAASLVTGMLVVSTLALLIARGRIPTTLAIVTVGAVFWATTLAAIAAVGIYVIRIYKDVRNRPQYIIESTIGLSKMSEDVLAHRAVR